MDNIKKDTMKLLVMISILFTMSALSSCSQSVKLVSVTPTEIKGYNKEVPDDNGVRTLEVKLRLSGKRRDAKFSLILDAGK